MRAHGCHLKKDLLNIICLCIVIHYTTYFTSFHVILSSLHSSLNEMLMHALKFQMLIRGANGVGYTSYPDNVVVEFIRLAAQNGMDIFRIFDCFNIVDNMRVSIEAVRSVNKVAEVCLCYTGNVLTSKIYNLGYYKDLAREAEVGFTYADFKQKSLEIVILLRLTSHYASSSTQSQSQRFMCFFF